MARGWGRDFDWTGGTGSTGRMCGRGASVWGFEPSSMMGPCWEDPSLLEESTGVLFHPAHPHLPAPLSQVSVRIGL